MGCSAFILVILVIGSRAIMQNFWGIDINNSEAVSIDNGKYEVPVVASFANESAPVSVVYEVVVNDVSDINIQTLGGFDKIRALSNQTYLAMLVDLLDIRSKLFIQCTDLAKQIPVFHIPSLQCHSFRNGKRDLTAL